MICLRLSTALVPISSNSFRTFPVVQARRLSTLHIMASRFYNGKCPAQECMVFFLMSAVLALVLLTEARPDSGETIPLPGPGLSYGGIPYGSMSGNVAEFFRRQAASGGRSVSLIGLRGNNVDYAPIEQYL